MKAHHPKVVSLLENKSPAKRLSERLNYLMKNSHIDGVQLGFKTGIPATTINRLRNDTLCCNPTLSTLVPLAEYFKVSVSQLIGEEPLSDTEKQQEGKNKKFILQKIPLLSWEDVEVWIEERHNLIQQINNWVPTSLTLSNHAFALKMEGDSMSPKFPKGTLLIFDQLQEFEDKDFVLLLQNEFKKPIFKQILIDLPDYYIKSLNDDYREIKKTSLNDHKLLGIMIQAKIERDTSK